jgi:hypothetical protein
MERTRRKSVKGESVKETGRKRKGEGKQTVRGYMFANSKQRQQVLLRNKFQHIA